MSWFKVDDGFSHSRQVLRIPARYRGRACGLWVQAGSWSARELTDGFIPEYMLDDFAASPAIARHLVKVGLWSEGEVDGEAGYQFEGWAKYQPTRAEVLAKRAAEAARKARYRARTAAANAPADASSSDPETFSTNPVSVSTNPARHGACTEDSALFDPARTARPADLQEHEMSQRDIDGTPAGQTAGHHLASEHPDPTRPDPVSYYVTNPPVSPRGGEAADRPMLTVIDGGGDGDDPTPAAKAKPKAKPASKRKPKVPFPDGWQPTREAVEALAAKHPGIDLRAEFDKFRNHAEATDRRLADWAAGFRNWIANAAEFAARDGRTGRAAAPRPCWPNGVPLTPAEVKRIQQVESRKSHPDPELLRLVGIELTAEQRANLGIASGPAGAIVDADGNTYDALLPAPSPALPATVPAKAPSMFDMLLEGA